MIRLADTETEEGLGRLLAGCGFDRALGSKIYTHALCYGNRYRFCDLWLVEADGQVAGAASQYNGTVTLTLSEAADPAEVGEFLQATVGAVFEMDAQTARRLGPHLPAHWGRATHPVLCWRGPAPVPTPLPPGRTLEETPPLGQVHQLLCQATPGFEGEAPFEAWYVDSSCRMRRGLCHAALVKGEGQALATAGVYHRMPGCGVIACVATHPRHRRQGYAAHLLHHLVGGLLEAGETPFLLAATPDLAPYYQGLGFSLWGEATVLTRTAGE